MESQTFGIEITEEDLRRQTRRVPVVRKPEVIHQVRHTASHKYGVRDRRK
jgi:hypothetical protein